MRSINSNSQTDIPVSVVIPSARQYPDTLISTLLAQATNDDEILLVKDDTWSKENWLIGLNTGGETETPRGEHLSNDRLQVLETKGKGGGAEARNVGWRAAENSWVLFLDDDTNVTDQFLEQVRTTIRQHPATNVATYRVMTPQSSDLLARLSEETISLDRGQEVRTTETALPIDAVWQYGVGAALATHQDLLHDINGYKNSLGPGRTFGGTEDIEMLWHASRHEGAITYDGRVQVKHQHVDTFAEWEGKIRDYGQAIGHLAGAVGSTAAKRWMSGYCALLRDVTTTEMFNDLPTDKKDKVENALNQAIEATHTSYNSTQSTDEQTLYLCERCR